MIEISSKVIHIWIRKKPRNNCVHKRNVHVCHIAGAI